EAKKLNLDAIGKDEFEELGKQEKVQKKKFAKKYDFFVASSDLMRIIARYFGNILGPRGKMPRPQPQGYGVISPSDKIEDLYNRYKKVIRLKLSKNPIIQFKAGNKNMNVREISENIKAALDFIENKLEKGRQNLRSIYIKTTMGEPVKVL
ncbi:MAG: 50S ribosomal protein L1, partial [Promethearchaeota archaeon]